jgi:hypothetical protein
MLDNMNGRDSELLKKIYYDASHPAGFGGVGPLARAAKLPQKQVQEWLKSQQSYTLHKPARRQGYKTRKYKTGGIDHQWQVDLADMQAEAPQNNGFKYILTVIDVFSRYAWAEPLKSKSPQHVKPAFIKIFNEGRKPFKIQSDQGLEFESNTMKNFFSQHGIHQFSVKSQYKAALVERFNRTLKAKMWRHLTHANSRKWLKVLPQLVSAYNKSHHRMIDMAPNDVDREVEMELWRRNESAGAASKKVQVKVGDAVRLNKAKRTFEQGYLPNWTEEVFTVVSVSNSNPPQIKVKDYDGNVIAGSFYIQEVQVVSKPEVYRIEQVIQSRKLRGKKQYLIKWLGYPKQFNSWIDEEQFVNLNG